MSGRREGGHDYEGFCVMKRSLLRTESCLIKRPITFYRSVARQGSLLIGAEVGVRISRPLLINKYTRCDKSSNKITSDTMELALKTCISLPYSTFKSREHSHLCILTALATDSAAPWVG